MTTTSTSTSTSTISSTTTTTSTTITTTATTTSTPTTTTPHCWANCSWRGTGNCNPTGPENKKAKHDCGETTCFYRAGYCDCNGNGELDNFTGPNELGEYGSYKE